MKNIKPHIVALTSALALAVGGLAAPQAVASPESGISLKLPQHRGASYNDPECKPTNGSNPVVFIHGTTRVMNDWANASNYLKELGYCTYAFNFGDMPGRINYGWDDLNVAAEDVEIGIDNILKITGAEKVNLIGHSQGGMMVKKYIEQLGHADKVDRAITFGASFGGTDYRNSGMREFFKNNPDFAKAMVGIAAYQQVIKGDDMEPEIRDLRALKDTSPGILYTAVYSPRDKVVTDYAGEGTPYGINISSTLKGEEGWVVNVNADEVCGYTTEPAHERFPFEAEPIKLMAWGLSRTVDMTEPICGADADERRQVPILESEVVVPANGSGIIELTNLSQVGTNVKLEAPDLPEGWTATAESSTLKVTATDTFGTWQTIPVIVTVDNVESEASVRVLAMPANVPTPTVNVAPGELFPKQAAELTITNLDQLPEGTSLRLADNETDFELVDVSGTYVLSPTAEAPGGENIVDLVATYPDGSTTDVKTTVSVIRPEVTMTVTTTATKTTTATATVTATQTVTAEPSETPTVTTTAATATHTVTETESTTAATATHTVTVTAEPTETPTLTTTAATATRTVTVEPTATRTVTSTAATATETVTATDTTTVYVGPGADNVVTETATTTVTEPAEAPAAATVTVTETVQPGEPTDAGTGSSEDSNSSEENISSEANKPLIIALSIISAILAIVGGILGSIFADPRGWAIRLKNL